MPKRRRDPPVRPPLMIVPADARREVEGWSQVELVDFVLDRAFRDAAVWQGIERRIAEKRGVVVEVLNGQIDRALDVEPVKWDRVSAFVSGLHLLLADVMRLGDRDATTALEVAIYFLKKVPTVFDLVNDEGELGWFCEELAKGIVKLALAARANVVEVAGVLLDAYVVDGYSNMKALPTVAVGLGTTSAEREALAVLFEERAGTARDYRAKDLRELGKSDLGRRDGAP